MTAYRRGSHTVYDIKYRPVRITRYRYEIVTRRIGERLRELLIQGCESRGIPIVEGSVGKEHEDMPVSCPAHIVRR